MFEPFPPTPVTQLFTTDPVPADCPFCPGTLLNLDYTLDEAPVDENFLPIFCILPAPFKPENPIGAVPYFCLRLFNF